ncbi:histone acetyltransferase [Paenibacillus sp. CAA11]|uniref:GNAT family N-acetyltransferase n=1 Tax=Paenibacillus sp. CAA11 TaxID=1532905 RepID=UPI000D35FD43|nr:GNAT family N-acetyltransferase [Paenibacillus sp. CAA11]AWB45959.1 histone acetyltransferase [Paenibacillus sp. CAA11]
MITQLSLHDPDILSQLWLLQHQAYRMESEAIGLKDAPPLTDTLESLQASPEVFFGLVTEEGELLGAVSVKKTRETSYEITRLMVHPEHLRKGIARSLLQHVLEVLPETSDLTVTAGSRNHAAVALYQDFGFAPEQIYEPLPGVELTVYRRTWRRHAYEA